MAAVVCSGGTGTGAGVSGNAATQDEDPSDASPPDMTSSRSKRGSTRSRREKYAARACVECQQRKVKCSGEDTCRQCHNRNVPCIYSKDKDKDKDTQNKQSVTRPRATTKRRRVGDDNESLSQEDSHEASSKSSLRQSAPDVALLERIQRLEDELRSISQYGLAPRHHDMSQSMSLDLYNATSPSMENTSYNSELTGVPTIGSAIQPIDLESMPDGETDTFDVLDLKTQSLSLPSQLASLRKNLGLGARIAEPRFQHGSNGPDICLELPDPSQTRHLLDVYFRDFECYLPYLDQNDTERRISKLLDSLKYSAHNQNLFIEPRHYPLAALLCIILAMAESLDPETVTREDARPGWVMYVQGSKLIQRCSSVDEIDLDLIRYYAIASGYFMHAENLGAATHAISVAIQLATKAKLNDQEAWSHCSPEEVMARKRLWWTIYFVDRRIGQKNGTAYIIRDSEVGVEDFSSASKSGAEPSWPSPERWDGDVSRLLSGPSSDSNDYLQVLVDVAKLWTSIWDEFFAVKAPSRGNWDAIMSMDKRILDLQQQLPQHLKWDSGTLPDHSEEDEPQIRRRLMTLTRINTLRLIIRQNPLVEEESNIETRRFCAHLASQTIDAIASFHKVILALRPCGYFISASLVECICQLVPLLQTPCLPEERTSAVVSFRTAYKILVDLARTMNSANRAIKALNRAFSVGEVVSLFKALVAEVEQNPGPQQQYLSTENSTAPQQIQAGNANSSFEGFSWSPEFEFPPLLSETSARPQETSLPGFDFDSSMLTMNNFSLHDSAEMSHPPPDVDIATSQLLSGGYSPGRFNSIGLD